MARAGRPQGDAHTVALNNVYGPASLFIQAKESHLRMLLLYSGPLTATNKQRPEALNLHPTQYRPQYSGPLTATNKQRPEALNPHPTPIPAPNTPVP